MKKVLSITTALASLVAFYGVNVSAEPSVEVEQSKQNVNKEIEQKKVSRSDSIDEGHESETLRMNKAKAKLEEREKRVCGKGDRGCGCKHDASFKEGPRITIGGGFDIQFHKTSDVKDYDVIPGDDNFADSNALFGEFSNGIVGDYSKISGSSVDTVLNVRAENTNYDLGLMYGADVRINVPITKSGGMRSRGAHIFANTEVGDVNIGFMEGAESMMRVDASRIAAGDGGADSDWFRKANLEGHRGNFPFYVTPHLYSESLFSESNWLSFRDSVKYNKSFIDTQPFRVSYFSPSFMGLKAGVSYSPNYDSDLFATGGMQKIKYIDPAQNPGVGVDMNSNFLNYKWYNIADATFKATRTLSSLGDPVNIAGADDGASLILVHDIARDAYNAANNAYEWARINMQLPDISAINAVINVPAIGQAQGQVSQDVHDLITAVVHARIQNDTAQRRPVGELGDARGDARDAIIYASHAAARLAAMSLGQADAQMNPNAGAAQNPAVVDQDVHNDRLIVIDMDGNPILNGPLAEAININAGGNQADAKTHAREAAMIAFRAAATAQSALGVNIGTAKEFYTLLATSGNYVGPNYENIVSGGISYEYDFDDFKVKVSATGEKGQVKEIKGDRYGMYGKYNDLMAFNLGLSAEYFGFKFAASYANLGKSGQPKEICIKDANNNKYDCKDDKVKDLQKDTYYWTAGAGYEFGNAYVSATYFKSKSAEANELSDIAIGAEYNLSPNGSKNPLIPYFTWHHFNTKEKDLPADKKNNKGNIFLVGVKHSF